MSIIGAYKKNWTLYENIMGDIPVLVSAYLWFFPDFSFILNQISYWWSSSHHMNIKMNFYEGDNNIRVLTFCKWRYIGKCDT